MSDPHYVLTSNLSQIQSEISNLQRQVQRDLDGLSSDVDATRQHASNADQGIQALERSFSELYQQLHTQLHLVVERLEPLKRMPELFEHLETVIQRQFELSFVRQFEAQVVAFQGHIRGHESRIRALQQLLVTRRDQLLKQLDKLRERYGTLLATVAENNESRRKALDSHAYSLIESVYPGEVQARFSHVSLPAYGYLTAHASEAALVRNEVLEQAHRKLSTAIDGYLTDFQAALEEIDSWIDEGRKPGRYVLPVVIAEVEDIESGRRRLELRTRDGDELPEPARRGVETFLRAMAREGRQRLSEQDKERLAQALAGRGVCETERARFTAGDIQFLETP